MQKIKFAIALLALALGVIAVACGDDDTSPATSSGTPGATVTRTAAPTYHNDPYVEPITPTPQPALSADSAEVQAVLALPGFRDFASAFAAAVKANDTQFLIDRAYIRPMHCPSPGEKPSLATWCGMSAPPPEPVIGVGLWNSEGDVATAEGFDDLMRERLSAERAPDAYVFALGRNRHPLTEDLPQVEVAVAYVASSVAIPGSPEAVPQSMLSFTAAPVDSDWRIVAVDLGATILVPYFYEWYALWDDAFVAN